MTKDVKIQNIILPPCAVPDIPSDMMFHADAEPEVTGNGPVSFKTGTTDFFTYFNSLSASKWKEYTKAEGFSLNLAASGSFDVVLTGYRIGQDSKAVRTAIDARSFNLPETTDISICYPDTGFDICSFEISSDSGFRLESGYYSATVEESDIRDVLLAIVITTFKRERYVTENLERLRYVSESGDAYLHDRMHVFLVDNGRSESLKSLNDRTVTYVPNPNVGGSGGFSRGMIETMGSDLPITHVILMDDDISFMPEALVRTYSLLSLIQEGYKDRFISGSMLNLDDKGIQFEDVGYVHKGGSFRPVKPSYDLRIQSDVLLNEAPLESIGNMYSAWWYCCIPSSFVRDDNLPLPLFVRGDDVEYSLRNKARPITLGGICVWHEPFYKKYSQSMELYQVVRNGLMIQAISGVPEGINLRIRAIKLFVSEICRLNYCGASQVLDAMEDYLKGPSVLTDSTGENLVLRQRSRDEQLQPLESLGFNLNDEDLSCHSTLSSVKMMLYLLTVNGHLLPPRMLKGVAFIQHGCLNCAGDQYMANKVVSVDIYRNMAVIRNRDGREFRRLIGRCFCLVIRGLLSGHRVRKEYRDSKDFLISHGFWIKHLGL